MTTPMMSSEVWSNWAFRASLAECFKYAVVEVQCSRHHRLQVLEEPDPATLCPQYDSGLLRRLRMEDAWGFKDRRGHKELSNGKQHHVQIFWRSWRQFELQVHCLQRKSDLPIEGPVLTRDSRVTGKRGFASEAVHFRMHQM